MMSAQNFIADPLQSGSDRAGLRPGLSGADLPVWIRKAPMELGWKPDPRRGRSSWPSGQHGFGPAGYLDSVTLTPDAGIS
jgi:hypothetical protein